MRVFKIEHDNVLHVAKLMARIKCEWWDVEGAIGQLNTGIGWYFATEENHPKGWVLCKQYDAYKTGEIECLGYDDNGSFKIGKELQPLIEESEAWAKEKGYEVMRFTIGSRGLSCHLKELRKPWEELRDLYAVDREEFNWFLSMGYIPSGILPNIYGANYHGILLVKQL